MLALEGSGGPGLGLYSRSTITVDTRKDYEWTLQGVVDLKLRRPRFYNVKWNLSSSRSRR